MFFKMYFRALFISCLIFPSTSFSLGQDVRALVKTQSSKFFASVDFAGIYTSGDDGKTWTFIDPGPDRYSYVWQIAETKQHTVIATTEKGIFRSIDQGKTWMASSGFPADAWYWVFSFAQNSKGDLFASINEQPDNGKISYKLYRSQDDGKSWVEIKHNMENMLFYSLTINSKDEMMGAGQSGVEGRYKLGFFRSVDGGNSWNYLPIEIPGASYSWTIATSSSDEIFATVHGKNADGSNLNGLYVSENAENWTLKMQGLPESAVVTNLFFTKTGIHYCSADNKNNDPNGEGRGIYLSSDHGLHWISLNQNLPKDILIHSIFADENGIITLGAQSGQNHGIIQSRDGGKNWNPVLVL